jgi:hypothetical protein
VVGLFVEGDEVGALPVRFEGRQHSGQSASNNGHCTAHRPVPFDRPAPSTF